MTIYHTVYTASCWLDKVNTYHGPMPCLENPRNGPLWPIQFLESHGASLVAAPAMLWRRACNGVVARKTMCVCRFFLNSWKTSMSGCSTMISVNISTFPLKLHPPPWDPI